ncbi:hydroxyacid dehydrogenase [Patescibacteria group bacterium]|nr:hydroxyacid dehydrogenase [Patescibacteria group bacterium]MBU1922010.1 hydroxyacid dehydrogenase [Patescibacteria group bacterium]
MKWKILNTDAKHYPDEAQAILRGIGQATNKEITQDELKQEIPSYNILVVGLGLLIDKEVINRGKDLKIIASATTGLNHIDVDYAESKGIKVVSLKGEQEFLSKVTSTAELALGLLVCLMRKIVWSFDGVRKDKWASENFREHFEGHELRGRVMGIVGLGRLGRIMARYAEAFYMEVLAYDPYAEDSVFEEWGVKRVDLPKLLNSSDIVSIHIPLDRETENLIGRKEFEQMKKSAYLVNTSRGEIINENDFLWALENKIITGAAVDVLAGELYFNKQTVKKNKLINYAKTHDDLLIVPHIGGMTVEAAVKTRVFIAEKLKNETAGYKE